MVLLGMRLQAVLGLSVFSKGSPMSVYKFYDSKEFYNDFLKSLVIGPTLFHSFFTHKSLPEALAQRTCQAVLL